MTSVNFEKIATLIILFKEFNNVSLKTRTKRSVLVILEDGDSLIKGRWATSLYVKYFSMVGGKIKMKEKR